MKDIADLNDLISTYNTGLTMILDNQVPQKIITVMMRGQYPWLSQDICPDNALKQNLESKMKRTNTPVDKQNPKVHYWLPSTTSHSCNKCLRFTETDKHFVNTRG